MEFTGVRLYKPSIKILYNSTLQDLSDQLEPYGFILTEPEDWYPILHGCVWITEEDEVVVHFYFSEDRKLESFMITGVKSFSGDTLVKSYTRHQKWLELMYGKGQIVEKNQNYSIMHYEWNLDCCKIEHFIKDRFGDEEGIYFKIL